MAAKYNIGLDVGATKILGGVIDCSNGHVVSIVKLPSPIGGGEGIVKSVKETVRQLLDQTPKEVERHIGHIGVGVAGQVDGKAGVLRAAPNLGGGVTDVQISKPLQDEFKRPVVLGNDVEVAALGESRFGAGRGVHLFACVFVGTGIGGALMQDGVRFKGASGSAGEIGHITVRAGGRMCGCGQRGHLESYASRTAIVEILREEVQGGTRSSISPLLLDTSQRVKSKPLSEAVDAGDELVVSVMTQAAMYLGLGLANLMNLWNPQRIVLGGGVIDRIDMLFNLAASQGREQALQVASANVDIVRAALGDNSGMVGAALLQG